MAADPFTQFDEWFAAVEAAGLEEPNTFVLATSGRDGAPSARALLMKGFDGDGLVFYTGLESPKSRQMEENPRAAATFVWIPLHRQVRFEGAVSKLDDVTADAYFATRPRGAQLAAHASRQGRVVPSRDELEAGFAAIEKRYVGGEVPRPEHWGGWRLTPSSVEFWQGRPNRFHDRVRYVLAAEGWTLERLAP